MQHLQVRKKTSKRLVFCPKHLCSSFLPLAVTHMENKLSLGGRFVVPAGGGGGGRREKKRTGGAEEVEMGEKKKKKRQKEKE